MVKRGAPRTVTFKRLPLAVYQTFDGEKGHYKDQKLIAKLTKSRRSRRRGIFMWRGDIFVELSSFNLHHGNHCTLGSNFLRRPRSRQVSHSCVKMLRYASEAICSEGDVGTNRGQRRLHYEKIKSTSEVVAWLSSRMQITNALLSSVIVRAWYWNLYLMRTKLSIA